MKNRSYNLALSSLVLVGLSSMASAQTVSIGAVDFCSNPGNLTNGGLPSGGINTVFTASVSTGYVLTNFVNVLTANVVSNGGGTWRSEPGFRMENSAFPGQSAYFNLINGNFTYSSFNISTLTSRTLLTASSGYTWGVPATLLAGTAIPTGSTWTFEAYESFDDIAAGADATGTGISFTLPGNPPSPPTAPNSIDLGVISASNSTLTTLVPALGVGEVKWYRFTLPANVDASTPDFLEIWTEDSGAGPIDTEIGLYSSTGDLIADDDDTGVLAFSNLSFGSGSFPGGGTGVDGTTLSAGTYYLSASKYNTEFAAGWSVSSDASAGIEFNLKLATSVVGAPGVALTGTLNLNDTSASFAFNRSISYAVKQGTTTVASGTVTADASSESFSISVPASATGAATIEWDGSSFLLRKTNVNLTGSAIAVGSVSVQNGDVDNSGEVDAADIDEVIADFGITTNDPSDVDVSGEVDAADIDIVIANFGGTND